MSERVFVDTNVLLYADDTSVPAKQKRARELIAELMSSGRFVVSTQVLQEFFVNATRKLGLDATRARDRVETWSQLDVVVLRSEHVLGAIDVHRLHEISFWDALIVRAAGAARCSKVASEDLQHGQVIDGVRIENPFA